MLKQINKGKLPQVCAQDKLEVLKTAAKGHHILLVLDDVWDGELVSLLNCIDLDTRSRLVVTTRIHALIRGATEVDVGVIGGGTFAPNRRWSGREHFTAPSRDRRPSQRGP